MVTLKEVLGGAKEIVEGHLARIVSAKKLPKSVKVGRKNDHTRCAESPELREIEQILETLIKLGRPKCLVRITSEFFIKRFLYYDSDVRPKLCQRYDVYKGPL